MQSVNAEVSTRVLAALDNAQGSINKAGLSEGANSMYIKTQQAIDDFCEKLMKPVGRAKPDKEAVPVTAVTFAAPRVGDISFAQRFGEAR